MIVMLQVSFRYLSFKTHKISLIIFLITLLIVSKIECELQLFNMKAFSVLYCPFSESFIKLWLTNKNCINLYNMIFKRCVKWFTIYVHWKVITTIKLINTSITSQTAFLYLWYHIYNQLFQWISDIHTMLSTIITMFLFKTTNLFIL